MMEDANEIWKKFDFFVKGRLKNIPTDFKYPDLNKFPKEAHQDGALLILQRLYTIDANLRFRSFMEDWQNFSEDE